MITVLSSPKHGSGTSTAAALIAIAASNDAPTTLVDLTGDQTALFNCPAVSGDIYVNDRLTLHNAMEDTLEHQIAAVQAIDPAYHVVIDAGDARHPIIGSLPTGIVNRWVVRPCYLALRRAGTYAQRPDEIIMLSELGRSLSARDIEVILSAPVVATIDVHPEIARLVDAGLLSARPPRHVTRHLARLVRAEEVTQP